MAQPGDCLRDIDVVVLAGGLGTRIRDHLDAGVPKILAPVGTGTYLDFLIRWLRGFGAQRVVLALGHLAGAVAEYVNAHPAAGIDIVLAVEGEPLGTAGALRFVDDYVTTDPVLVMNGDSVTGADLCRFVAAHGQSGADASILLAKVSDTVRYGRVEVTQNGRVERFREKDARATGPGLINAGVYLFGAGMRRTIATMPGASLERDVFQELPKGTLNAVTSADAFIDIGTPEGLADAAEVIAPQLDRD